MLWATAIAAGTGTLLGLKLRVPALLAVCLVVVVAWIAAAMFAGVTHVDSPGPNRRRVVCAAMRLPGRPLSKLRLVARKVAVTPPQLPTRLTER